MLSDVSASKTVEKVIIIGAGTSGLALAYNLKRQNIIPKIFDKGSVIADTWRKRHKQLELNTHRRYSKLPGLSIPRSAGVFTSRDAFVSYLEHYESLLSLPINFGVAVNRIDRVNGFWQLSTTEGQFLTEHVVIATGQEHVPLYPDLPGSEHFAGQLVHAANAGDAESYVGKKVLVIGGGNSGVDILNNLVRFPVSKLWLSIRSGTTILPKGLFGIPALTLTTLVSKLPPRLLDYATHLTERLAFGDLRRFGWKPSSEGAMSRFFSDGTAFPLDDGFVNALKKGKVIIVPEALAINIHEVRLKGDELIQPDVIICATGYTPGLETLVGHLDVLDEKGSPTFQGCEANADVLGLWFLGMRQDLRGNIYGHGLISGSLAEKISAALASTQS